MYDVGIFFKKPASTIKSGFIYCNSLKTFVLRSSFLKNETFREYVRSNTPALRALERVYEVGVEVNRFQKEELAQCE